MIIGNVTTKITTDNVCHDDYNATNDYIMLKATTTADDTVMNDTMQLNTNAFENYNVLPIQYTLPTVYISHPFIIKMVYDFVSENVLGPISSFSNERRGKHSSFQKLHNTLQDTKPRVENNNSGCCPNCFLQSVQFLKNVKYQIFHIAT